MKFQQGKRIEGSQNWQGQQYTVFRNYRSEWHDQNWWHSHYHNNIVFVFGAPYYWNAGYWFPAWGYSPNAYYAWDGPIYGYNHLPPDQVIANVQAALQQLRSNEIRPDLDDPWVRVLAIKLGVDGGVEAGYYRDPYGRVFRRSETIDASAAARNSNSRTMPSPPFQRPLPPEPRLRRYSVTRTG